MFRISPIKHEQSHLQSAPSCLVWLSQINGERKLWIRHLAQLLLLNLYLIIFQEKYINYIHKTTGKHGECIQIAIT